MSILAAVPAIHVVIDSTPPSTSPLWAVGPTLLGFLIGLFADQLKGLIFRPKLRLSFVPDEHCLRITPAQGKYPNGEVVACEMSVVRFRVDNRSRFFLAKKCVAYLDQVEVVSAAGAATLLFADRISLKWAYIGYNPQDVPGATGLYCDLVSISSEAPLMLLHSLESPFILTEAFRNPGQFRFRCLVAGENFAPQTIKLTVDWKNEFPIRDVWQGEAPN